MLLEIICIHSLDDFKDGNILKFCIFFIFKGGKVPISSQYIPCDVCKETLESMAGEVRNLKVISIKMVMLDIVSYNYIIYKGINLNNLINPFPNNDQELV
jgi:hypothetical protein